MQQIYQVEKVLNFAWNSVRFFVLIMIMSENVRRMVQTDMIYW